MCLISLPLLVINLYRAVIALSCLILSFLGSQLPQDFMVNIHEPEIRPFLP